MLLSVGVRDAFKQTRRAFHTVNIRSCATPALQILFDPDTESKFRFEAICIERRESKGPFPCCPVPFVLERGFAFRAENITPVKITRGRWGDTKSEELFVHA